MIEELLPPGVMASWARDDVGAGDLYDEERAVVARAVERRVAEFATTRACARRALAQLGYPPGPIPRGTRREPVWPEGVVGSLTHCDGFRAAAVAPAASFRSLGIDAEPHARLPDGVERTVALPGERRMIAELADRVPEVCWDRLLFSAKESVYKAWFPLAGRWLGFDEAEVTFDPAARTFVARLLVEGPEVDGRHLTAFDGTWRVMQGLVLTAVVVPGAVRAQRPATRGGA